MGKEREDRNIYRREKKYIYTEYIHMERERERANIYIYIYAHIAMYREK